jgi:glutaminyl-tRNA synthetase
VRLRYAYIIKCVGVTRDPQTGEITELHCTYDPTTKSGASQEQRKVKATIHWVSGAHAVKAEVRLYNPLLVTDLAKVPPDHDWTTYLNPNSLERITSCRVEPSLQQTVPGARYQFERLGYFCTDPDSASGTLIFNRTVSLKDAWAKIEKTQLAR